MALMGFLQGSATRLARGLAIFLSLSALLVASPACAKRHVDAVGGFALEVPDDWQLRMPQRRLIGPGGVGFATKAERTQERSLVPLETFADLAVASLKQEMKFTEQGTRVAVPLAVGQGTQQAFWDGQGAVAAVLLVVKHDGYFWQFILMAHKPTWESRREELLKTLHTVQVFVGAEPTGAAVHAPASVAALPAAASTVVAPPVAALPPVARPVAAAPQPVPAAQTGLALDPAQALAGAPRSLAVTQLPGEIYMGPGPMTVGYLGAKRQLVLPNGTWVLLAVQDRPSGHTTPIELTSMVFGQFREGKLTSLMSYLFNGRATTAHKWGDAAACQDGSEVHQTASRPKLDNAKVARWCAWALMHRQLPNVNDAGWQQALVALQRLGAPPPAGSMVFSRAWALNEQGSSYLQIRRADFEPAASLAVQASRSQWLEAYLPLMHEGFDKRLSADDLQPINTSAGASVRMQLPN